ncbi:MAG: hypothetical protein U0V56_11925 [Actinomycetota bacterium]
MFCPRHPSRRVGTSPAEQVQQELLSTYGVEVMPLERVAGPLRSPVFRRRAAPAPSPARVARTLAIGLIRAIGFAVQAVFVLWMCLGFLGFAAAFLFAVLGLFERTVDVHVTPARPNVEAVVATDGWMADPPVTPSSAFPPFAFLCGRSDGPVVHIVGCDEPDVDLWGFSVGEPPSGPGHDCAPGWLAYTREPDRWICWHPVPGETPDVRAWTAADENPFDGDGG